MDFDLIDVPASGSQVQYDSESGAFDHPDEPIVPYIEGDGVGESVVTAARRVLDEAADEMGRSIRWMHLPAGSDAVDRYGHRLPEETVDALTEFRVGLVGPLSTRTDDTVEVELRRRLGLDTELKPISHLGWTPSPVTSRDGLDIVCFRDTTEDADAKLEYADDSTTASRLRTALKPDLERAGISGPAGFGVRPITRTTTERLVERAVEYAFDRDRSRITIVHQGNRLPASEGGFHRWAREFLDTEYGDSIIGEEAFREAGSTFPEDELVVSERHTDEALRELLTSPTEYDVVVAPSLAGEYVSAVAAESAGGTGVTPTARIGDGRLVVGPEHGGEVPVGGGNPIATIRAGCVLLEFLGWDDVVGVVREALEATLAEGVGTADLARRATRGEIVSSDAFADRVVEQIRAPREPDPSGGVRTSGDERSRIGELVAGLYNVVFEDVIRPEDIHLNQLRGEDEEADIYLPEVGINFRYWRRWSVERRLEVLLHELAHVENYDDDHAPTFYDRLVELTEIAEEWSEELESLFGDPIDFDLVKREIVESVHEETIELDIESIDDRKRALRRAFRIDRDDHF